MKIELSLNRNIVPYVFEMKNDFGYTNVYEGFKIDYTKEKRVYLVAMNGGIPYTRFYKNMNFEDGKVIVKFNKDKMEIGTYKEVEWS